jgi:hypothetical protein
MCWPCLCIGTAVLAMVLALCRSARNERMPVEASNEVRPSPEVWDPEEIGW